MRIYYYILVCTNYSTQYIYWSTIHILVPILESIHVAYIGSCAAVMTYTSTSICTALEYILQCMFVSLTFHSEGMTLLNVCGLIDETEAHASVHHERSHRPAMLPSLSGTLLHGVPG